MEDHTDAQQSPEKAALMPGKSAATCAWRTQWYPRRWLLAELV